MSDQKTRVDSGSSGGVGDATVYSGQSPSRSAGSWEQTQYANSEQPTPRPGQVPFPPAGAPVSPPPRPDWGAPAPAGGSQTVIMPTGPRPEPSFAWLVLLAGAPDNPFIGKIYEIKKEEATTLGRVQGSDIVIPDPTCSSQHARIRMETDENGEPAYVIYDMASSNGTFAGSKENYKEDSSRVYRHVLHDGDYILIGETTLVFKRV
jgi:pSer/pThr/pTyr-binding forkhead associated (FHA) protein